MSKSLGISGEVRASKYLERRGYHILEKNFRHGRNEVDLIAKKGNELIFVEVKTKSYTTFGNPEEAVSDAQATRILEAAEEYIYSVDWEGDIRFDVIAIEKRNDEYVLDHFEDAFH